MVAHNQNPLVPIVRRDIVSVFVDVISRRVSPISNERLQPPIELALQEPIETGPEKKLLKLDFLKFLDSPKMFRPGDRQNEPEIGHEEDEYHREAHSGSEICINYSDS